MLGRIPLILLIAVAVTLPPLLGQSSALPDLPAVSGGNFLPAIRGQVQWASVFAQAHPRDAHANGDLGMILDTYEQYDSAATCYKRAHLLEPDSFRWAYYLGWAQTAMGKYAEAESTLREALRLNPEYLPAQLKLAETLLAAGKLKESAGIYEALVKRHQDLASAHYGLGRVQWARRDEAAAVQSLGKACELFPPYGAAHYALALAYRRLGESDKSREQFKLYEQYQTNVPPLEDPLRAAVSVLNLGPFGHVRRAIAMEQAGKTEEAVAELEKALEAAPNNVQSHISLISLYGKLGQFEKAEQHYQSAVSLNPNQAETYYNYGVLLVKRGKNQDAERAFRRVLEINPYYAEAHHNLGVLLEERGRLADALAEYEKAIENHPNYRLAHFHAGRILVNQNRYDEAIQHFLKTLTPEDENTPRYLYSLAATYARVGDREQALRYARQARGMAEARGQRQLLNSIDKDLETLEKAGKREPQVQ
jgi:tetratricopeptide (TPR) repeat protein